MIVYHWQVIHCGGYLKVRLFGADMAPYEGCCHNSALVSSQLLHDYWGPNHVGPGFWEEGRIWVLRCEENEDNTFSKREDQNVNFWWLDIQFLNKSIF